MYTKTLELDLSVTLHAAIKAMADHREMSVNEWIREACIDHLPQPLLGSLTEDKKRKLIDSVYIAQQKATG